MTKEDELKLLDQTIKKFGPDSYIGPWLEANRESIAQDIAQDLPVSVTPLKATYTWAANLIADAKKEAEAIIAEAKAQQERHETYGRDNVQAVRASAAAALTDAAEAIRAGRTWPSPRY